MLGDACFSNQLDKDMNFILDSFLGVPEFIYLCCIYIRRLCYMKNNCLVSIVIPVHNTASYLYKCVESVRNQSLKDIEIILVENMSTDNSAEICNEYEKKDSRIKVLHLSVAGLSIARNEGIKAASAPYIGFIDSDDYIAPEMFGELLNALIKYKADLAYCNFCYEEAGGLRDSPYTNSGKVSVKSQVDVLRDMMWERISCSVCTKLFKKTFFANHAFPEGKMYEDRLVMHDWLLKFNKIVWVDKPLYYYVNRATSICHTVSPLNKYHYFLSEYSRLVFIREYAIFEGRELYEIRNRILRLCLSTFKEIMLMIKPRDFREPLEDMRGKFRDLLYLNKSQVDSHCYRRIRSIVYLWPIYYFIHFGIKRTKWY